MKPILKNNLSSIERARTGERGFSMLQLVLVVGIVVIVSAFSVIRISQARASMRLQNSARLFASYIEKARLDAIRRHTGTTVDISGPSSYDITMDFNGNGVPYTRRFTLETDVVFTDSNNATLTVDGSGNVSSPNGAAVPWADFDFRGRTTECTMLFRLKNSNSVTSTVQVMGSGDVTVDTAVFSPSTVTYGSVNTTSDVNSTATVMGNGTHNDASPCGTSGAATTTPPPTTGAGSCQIGPSVGLVTIRRNGGSTANINIIVNSAGTINASPHSNLAVTPPSRAVTAGTGGTFSFTVSSVNKSRGTFPVIFTSPCGSTTVQVKVTN